MKTVLTAVVAVPPDEAYESIQVVRRRHDRKIERWMPHFTLLHPFRPQDQFDDAASLLTEACAGQAPIEITLSEVGFFDHGGDRHTMWLAAEPPDPLVKLQASLQERFPDCDEASGFEGGYSPHMTVGQARGRPELEQRLNEVQSEWKPLRFTLKEIALITRTEVTPFQVDPTIPLGG